MLACTHVLSHNQFNTKKIPCLHLAWPLVSTITLLGSENRTGFGWLAEPGALAAGVGSNPDSTHVSHRDLFLKKFYSLYRVELQRDCDAPVAYGAVDGSGDLKKDAVFISACSCRSDCVRVVCVVCVVCVGVCSYMNRFYSCTQSRGSKKKNSSTYSPS